MTHLFADGGRIIKSHKRSYAEHVEDADVSGFVRTLMTGQHMEMLLLLRAGKLDEVIAGRAVGGMEVFDSPPEVDLQKLAYKRKAKALQAAKAAEAAKAAAHATTTEGDAPAPIPSSSEQPSSEQPSSEQPSSEQPSSEQPSRRSATPEPDPYMPDFSSVAFTQKKRAKRKPAAPRYTYSDDGESRPASSRSGVRSLDPSLQSSGFSSTPPSYSSPPSHSTPQTRVRSRPSSHRGTTMQSGTVSGWGKFRIESPGELESVEPIAVSAPPSWSSPRRDDTARPGTPPSREEPLSHSFRPKRGAEAPISVSPMGRPARDPATRRASMRPVEELLVELCARSKLIRGAAVVDMDGFLVDAAVPAGIDEEQAGGVIAALQGVGVRVSQDVLGSDLSLVHIATTNGIVILERFLPEYTMALMVVPDVKTGMLAIEIEQVTGELKALLSR